MRLCIPNLCTCLCLIAAYRANPEKGVQARTEKTKSKLGGQGTTSVICPCGGCEALSPVSCFKVRERFKRTRYVRNASHLIWTLFFFLIEKGEDIKEKKRKRRKKNKKEGQGEEGSQRQGEEEGTASTGQASASLESGEIRLPTQREPSAFPQAAAGSELLRVSNPGRLSDITPFLVG